MSHVAAASFPSTASLSPTVAAVLAHQGGWDEILLVAGPIAVIIGLLTVVKRRLDARLGSESRESTNNGSGSSGGVTGRSLDDSTDSA